MANVLKGIIQITAPGAKETFAAVGGGAQKTATALKSITPAANQSSIAINSVSTQASKGGSLFKSFGTSVNNSISPLRLMANIIPGLGIAGLVGALGSLVTGLFNTASAFDKGALAADLFKDKLDEIKEASDRLDSFLDLQNKISDLTFRIQFGDTAEADIKNFGKQLQSNQTIIKDATKNLNQLGGTQDELVRSMKEGSELLGKFGKKNPLVELFLAGKDLTKITKEQAETLPKGLKVIAEAYIENRKAITDEQKRLNDATQENNLLSLKIQKSSADEQRKAQEKQVSDFEKYSNDILSRAKQLSSEFPDIVGKFSENLFDTKAGNLTSAKKFIDKFFDFLANPANFKTAQINVPLDSKSIVFRNTDEVQKALTDLFKVPVTVPINPTLDFNFEAFKDNLNSILGSGFADLGASIGESFGQAISGNLGALEVITNTIADLIAQIGKALIQYGIVKIGLDKILGAGGFAIPGGVALGLGIAAIAAAQLLKNIKRRAIGGSVQQGETYLVGERGPELFKPNTGGAIVPNSGVGGGSFGGMGGGKYVFKIHGNDLIAVLATTGMSQSRLS